MNMDMSASDIFLPRSWWKSYSISCCPWVWEKIELTLIFLNWLFVVNFMAIGSAYCAASPEPDSVRIRPSLLFKTRLPVYPDGVMEAGSSVSRALLSPVNWGGPHCPTAQVWIGSFFGKSVKFTIGIAEFSLVNAEGWLAILMSCLEIYHLHVRTFWAEVAPLSARGLLYLFQIRLLECKYN